MTTTHCTCVLSRYVPTTKKSGWVTLRYSPKPPKQCTCKGSEAGEITKYGEGETEE